MSEIFYLVKYKDNWADEIDLDGHIVLEKDKFEMFDKIANTNPIFTMCIGTNEEIEYNKDWQTTSKAYSVIEITVEQYDVLKQLNILETRFAKKFVENVLYCEDQFLEYIDDISCEDQREDIYLLDNYCEECGEYEEDCICED
jgi:hypothetical protein